METLIVIAIILILSATTGFAAAGSLEKTRTAAARTQLESIASALEAFYMDCLRYPTTEEGLDALRRKPESLPESSEWNGPYLYRNIPDDPWGNEYEYTSPAPDGFPYGIRSFGADGQEGGEGRDADVTSW